MQKTFVFFCFLMVFLFSLCFCFFVWKQKPKRIFSCNFSFFSFLCSQEARLWNPSFLLFCFVSLFPFCPPPFKIPSFFFGFCPSTSFWKTLFYVSLFFVAFAFAHVCLLLSNKLPNIPSLKPKLLLFLALFLFCCFVFMVDVSAFLFWCWFYCVMFSFVLNLFCFVLFVYCFQTMKTLFSLQF